MRSFNFVSFFCGLAGLTFIAGCGSGSSSSSVAPSTPFMVSTPLRIGSISGNADSGQAIQIVVQSGKSFGSKTNSAPLYWNDFELETLGLIPSDQDAGHANSLVTVLDSSRANGSKSISYRYQTSGSEIFGRNYIDLGAQNSIYATMWVKISTAGTSTSWNWKGEYFSSNQLDYNGVAPHTTITKINFWDSLTGWYNPSYYNSTPGTTPSGTPHNEHLFDTWERLEYWIKRNTGPSVANGTIYINRIGLSSPIELNTSVITHNSQFTETWRYLNLGQGITSNYTGTVDITVSYDDIYVDNTMARVELCDSLNWASRSHCEIQPITTWSTNNITIKFNKGSFSTGQTRYLFVIDSNGTYDNSGYPVVIGNSY